MIDQFPIWTQMLMVFVSYFFFIYFRTSNVIHTTDRNIKGALISGGILHLLWVVSAGIGINAAIQFMSHYPVLIGSLTGGLLGTYAGIKNKQRNDKRSKYVLEAR